MSWPAVAHLRWHPFLGISFHDGVALPAPATVKLPHITFNVLNGLFLGSLPSTAGPGRVEGPWGIPFMGRTNDAGFISPHVSIPPSNPMLPFTILLGGSESLLGSSKVRIQCHNLIWGDDEYDMAACTIPFIPLSTNFGCNDPLFVPLDFVVSPNTVEVSISLMDVLNTLIDLLLMAVLDGLIALGTSGLKKVTKPIKAKSSARKLAKVSDEAGEATADAARKADLDATLRNALAKRRALIEGVDIPPPVSAADLAKKRGDEVFNKAFRREFPEAVATARPGTWTGRGIEMLRVGGANRVLVTAIKEVLGEAVVEPAVEAVRDKFGEPTPPTTGPDATTREGEAILATAGG